MSSSPIVLLSDHDRDLRDLRLTARRRWVASCAAGLGIALLLILEGFYAQAERYASARARALQNAQASHALDLVVSAAPGDVLTASLATDGSLDSAHLGDAERRRAASVRTLVTMASQLGVRSSTLADGVAAVRQLAVVEPRFAARGPADGAPGRLQRLVVMSRDARAATIDAQRHVNAMAASASGPSDRDAVAFVDGATASLRRAATVLEDAAALGVEWRAELSRGSVSPPTTLTERLFQSDTPLHRLVPLLLGSALVLLIVAASYAAQVLITNLRWPSSAVGSASEWLTRAMPLFLAPVVLTAGAVGQTLTEPSPTVSSEPDELLAHGSDRSASAHATARAGAQVVTVAVSHDSTITPALDSFLLAQTRMASDMVRIHDELAGRVRAVEARVPTDLTTTLSTTLPNHVSTQVDAAARHLGARIDTLAGRIPARLEPLELRIVGSDTAGIPVRFVGSPPPAPLTICLRQQPIGRSPLRELWFALRGRPTPLAVEGTVRPLQQAASDGGVAADGDLQTADGRQNCP